MKKGDNSEKKQKFKKVKDTILRYFDIGIYVKISDSYVKRWSLKSDDRQTHRQTKKTYILSKNRGNLFFYLQVFFIFYFPFSISLKVKKAGLQKHV